MWVSLGEGLWPVKVCDPCIRAMKLLVLLVFVFIGATSGCPLFKDFPEDSEGQWLDGWRAKTNVHTFEDDSCSTEKIFHGGSTATSSSELAADLGSECDTPQHGECFVFTTACMLRLQALCSQTLPGQFAVKAEHRWKTPKAMKVWYADQGGLPANINYAAVAAGVGGSVLLVIIMWLANCFGKPSCGEPSWMLCPSPLPQFKPKPSEPKASSGTSSSA